MGGSSEQGIRLLADPSYSAPYTPFARELARATAGNRCPEALRAFWCSAVMYTGRSTGAFYARRRALVHGFGGLKWKAAQTPTPVQTRRPGTRYEQSASAAVRQSNLISPAGAPCSPIASCLRQYPLSVDTAQPKSSSNRLRLADHDKRIRFDGRTTYRTPGLAEPDSCQTRVPCKRAAAAAASAPSGHLSHRQTNKGGSPEGPGDFFPTRPQPPSALKHDAAPPTLPPAYLLASDSRDSVEIKLLHAP